MVLSITVGITVDTMANDRSSSVLHRTVLQYGTWHLLLSNTLK